MTERVGVWSGYRRGAETIVRDTLALAGIEIGGGGSIPLVVNDERFYDRVLSQGAFGFGESYMDGWWDCDRIDQLVYRILAEALLSRIPRDFRIAVSWLR